MLIVDTFTQRTPPGRSLLWTRGLLLSFLAAAASAFLVVAAPAEAEIPDTVTAAATAVAESPASVETPVTSAANAVTAPVETQEVPSVPTDSAGATAEEDSTASTPSTSPVAAQPNRDTHPTAADIVEAVAATPSKAGVDQVLADTPLPSPKGHPVSKLIAESSRGTVEAVESIRNTAETLAPLAPVVDELPPLLPRPELTGDLLDFLTPAAIEALPLPSGPSQEAGSTSESGALDLSQPPRPDVFSHWSAIDPGGSFRKYLVAHGAIETVALGPSSSPSTSENALAAADRFGPTFTGSAAGRSGGHTPLDVPLPTPESPGAIASGPGDSLFVPIVALLALLALAAPAVPRRLWEGSDFRAPTPFVCALERPG